MSVIVANAGSIEHRYILFHYDLDTKAGEARDAAKALLDLMSEIYATRMTKSVYCKGIPAGVEARDYARHFWKILSKRTKEKLRAGDRIFLQYPSGANHGVFYSLLKDNENSLVEDPMPSVEDIFKMSEMFLELAQRA